MSLYDVERFESRPDPDLICCICHCVLDNPRESPCQHVFCKVCIETWLTNRNSCPSCRKRLREHKLKPALPIVKNMISRLIIKCENSEHGCKGKVQLEQYKTHIDNCDYVQIGCMNTGCTKQVLRKNMYKHEEECIYRLTPCKKGCGLPVPAKDANSHKCVEELKQRLEKLEDTVENNKKDFEMRLGQLENVVAELQYRAQQQDSSASEAEQDDDNSRDSPDDEDVNEPDSDEEYQSDGEAGDDGAGDDSGDDNDDDNGSNNDEEEDYSDGGNSRVSYESSSSVEYASDASSYSTSYSRDFVEYPREENSDDGSSNDSASVEEINPPSPAAVPATPAIPRPSRNVDIVPARNVPPSGTMAMSQVGRDFTGWVFSPSRGTITPYLEVPRSTSTTPATQQQQISVHTTLNSANTRLPPPPPYRPTASAASSSTVNVVSVSTGAANSTNRSGVVSMVTTAPSGVSVLPTSPPEIKMQLSFQVISRGQSNSTATSTITRPTAPLIPIQILTPVSNTSPSTSTNPQARPNRPTLNITTVTSTQTTSLVNRLTANVRPMRTNITHRIPIPLRPGISQADARAVLRPLATGSGSVIASRIPGTRRRRTVPTRFLSSSSSSSTRERNRNRTSSSTHRTHSSGQRVSAATTTVSAAPTSTLSSPQNPTSSSLNPTSSHQVSSSVSQSTTPNTSNRPTTSRGVAGITSTVYIPNPTRNVEGLTVSMTRCRNVEEVVVSTGQTSSSRLVRTTGEGHADSGNVNRTTEASTVDLQIRARKRRHNDDSSSSDESDVVRPSQRSRNAGPVQNSCFAGGTE